jgi:hypothetical protein
MKMKSVTTLLRGISATFLLTASLASAGEVNGTWTWSAPSRAGGEERVTKLTLKADGAKLTGKLVAPGRNGAGAETTISDGKVDGDNISFVVVRQNNGNSNTNHFSGKISGDKITGKIEGTRNGEKNARDWEAKRANEAK